MPGFGEVAIGVQNGAIDNGPFNLPFNHPALSDFELAAPPKDGKVFQVTVTLVARDCQVVSDHKQVERWSGVLDVVAVSPYDPKPLTSKEVTALDTVTAVSLSKQV